MNELTILDFALGIALLYHWGADGKEIRNFASGPGMGLACPH